MNIWQLLPNLAGIKHVPMSILTNFPWKIRQLLVTVGFFFAFTSFLAAQNCPTPTQLSKDSVTVSAVHFSWQAVPGAAGYKVSYTTPSDTFAMRVATNSVSFAIPFNTDYELFTVTTICRNGDESDPAALIDGGIFITVDDIFRLKDDCDNPAPNPPEYLFFTDICMFTYFSDLCLAIDVVDGGLSKQPQSPEEWLEDVLTELASGNYLWEPWDNPEGCQEPLRLYKQVFSDLTLSPNPFSDRLTVSFNLKKAGSYDLSIIDMMGRTMEKHRYLTAAEGSHTVSNLGLNLAPGIYFLQIQSADQQILINILKHE